MKAGFFASQNPMSDASPAAAVTPLVPLAVTEALLLSIFTWWLLRFYADKSTPFYAYILVFISWYLGFFGTLFLPIDIAEAYAQRTWPNPRAMAGNVTGLFNVTTASLTLTPSLTPSAAATPSASVTPGAANAWLSLPAGPPCHTDSPRIQRACAAGEREKLYRQHYCLTAPPPAAAARALLSSFDTSLMVSAYFGTQRSKHVISAIVKSPSLGFGMHFAWHSCTTRLASSCRDMTCCLISKRRSAVLIGEGGGPIKQGKE